MNDPGSFAIPESVIEGFESSHFCHHRCGHGAAPAWRDKLRVVWQEPTHPLLLQAPCESTHRIWMEAGFPPPGGQPCRRQRGLRKLAKITCPFL